jgi:hypothetical protein
MADALATLGHETRALTPSTWDPDIRHLDARRSKVGRAWWIGDRALIDECLEWCDCAHFLYSSSLKDLGRPDLLGKKPLVWHLPTKWKPGFMRHFPEDSHKHYRFVFSAEGWDRYELPPWRWKPIPVLFPIDEPLWRPIPFEKRQRRVTMTPRLTTDVWCDKRVPAPRGVPELKKALAGLDFEVISGVSWARAMKAKASSWLGIDDVVSPLVHFSGFEYLSLGVPCLNRSDEHMRRQLWEITGGPWPFVEACMETVHQNVMQLLDPGELIKAKVWSREWMEKYYSAALMAPRYVELYQ